MARAATASPSGELIDSRSMHGDEGMDEGSGDRGRAGEDGAEGGDDGVFAAESGDDGACSAGVGWKAAASAPASRSEAARAVSKVANTSLLHATSDVSSACPSVSTSATRLVVGERGKFSVGTMIQLWCSGENSVRTLLLPSGVEDDVASDAGGEPARSSCAVAPGIFRPRPRINPAALGITLPLGRPLDGCSFVPPFAALSIGLFSLGYCRGCPIEAH